MDPNYRANEYERNHHDNGELKMGIKHYQLAVSSIILLIPLGYGVAARQPRHMSSCAGDSFQQTTSFQPKLPNKEDNNIERCFGNIVEGMQVAIVPEKGMYNVGEPVSVKLVVRNVSDTSQIVISRNSPLLAGQTHSPKSSSFSR